MGETIQADKNANKKDEKKKINDTIIVFKEIIDKNKIALNSNGVPTKPIRKLMQLFKEVSDPRSQRMVLYPLCEIIMASFIAILAGAGSFNEIAAFCVKKSEWLKENFKIKSGVPSHDTFRRVFMLIDPQQLQKATVAFLVENIKLLKRAFSIDDSGMNHVCVDGKVARGTGRLKGTDREVQQLQTLHVYDRSNAICLVSEAIESKTNEIPVAQKMLKLLDLRNTVVTCDALNTQRETINVIDDRKGDYVCALKKNQHAFYQEVETFFTPERLKRIEAGKTNFKETKEKSHNRIETRRYFLSTNVSWLLQTESWKKLKSLVHYSLRTEDINTGKITDESYYYIASLADIELCAQSIRGHWSVEVLHWHLDVNYLEDDTEIIDRVAFQNKSLLNKMALTLTKLIAPILKNSIRLTKKIIAWDLNTFLDAFRILDEDILAEALLNVKA
jgi:predicted transposase YbfD/YdcC